MSDWSYDERARSYRDTATGRFLSPASERTLADDFLSRRRQAVTDLAAKVSDGSMSVQDWERAMAKEIRQAHGVSYALGAGGRKQVTEEQWADLAKVVTAQQETFLRPFAQQLADGQMSAAQIANRAGMYVDAANTSYEVGHAAAYGDLSLPVYPGQDCLGLVRCRCRWQIAETADGWDCTWIAADDPNTCEVCAAHAAEWNPLSVPKADAVAA